uniref:Uncharacterized protein n=1 Tax=Oryza glumipatula TaxID=40148 RepID=A0A0D9YYE3_9ORYZ
MKPQALVVQNAGARMPMSLATLCAKLITPSGITQLTGGVPGSLLSRARRAPNAAGPCVRKDVQTVGMSCVTSSLSDSDGGGRPSGMVSNRKSSRPASAPVPRERRRRRWLYSELTKVTWNPLEWSTLARCRRGVTWPCAGYGMSTACRREFEPMASDTIDTKVEYVIYV